MLGCCLRMGDAVRAPVSPGVSQGRPAWLKAAALGMAALAMLAPGRMERSQPEHFPPPAALLPCLCLHHVTGTSSNTLQMNFLIYRHFQKKKKRQTKTINILFFFFL